MTTLQPKIGDIVIYFRNNIPYLAQFTKKSRYYDNKWLYLISDIPYKKCACEILVDKIIVIKNVPDFFKKKYFKPNSDYINHINHINDTISALEELYIICANKIKTAWLNKYYKVGGKGYYKSLNSWNKNNTDLEQIELKF